MVKQIETANVLRKFVLLSMSNISPDTIVYTINLPCKLFPPIPHTFIELLLSATFTFIILFPLTTERGKCILLSLIPKRKLRHRVIQYLGQGHRSPDLRVPKSMHCITIVPAKDLGAALARKPAFVISRSLIYYTWIGYVNVHCYLCSNGGC